MHLDKEHDTKRSIIHGSISLPNTRVGTPLSDLEPDEILLSLLTSTVKAITSDQVARFVTFSKQDPKAAACRLLKKLSKNGLIKVANKTVRLFDWDIKPLLVVTKQLTSSVDCASLAWQLKKREQKSTARVVKVVTPTRVACKSFGGREASIKASQLAHDLHATHVALLSHHRGYWVREDYLGGYGFTDGAQPDGFIVTPDDQPNIVVEIGSATYDKSRLQTLVDAFGTTCDRFEVW